VDRPLRMVQGMGFLRDEGRPPIQRPAAIGGGGGSETSPASSSRLQALHSSIDKASEILEEARGRAQRVIDRYDALSMLVGHTVAAQALEEAKVAFLKAQDAVQDLKQLEV